MTQYQHKLHLVCKTGSNEKTLLLCTNNFFFFSTAVCGARRRARRLMYSWRSTPLSTVEQKASVRLEIDAKDMRRIVGTWQPEIKHKTDLSEVCMAVRVDWWLRQLWSSGSTLWVRLIVLCSAVFLYLHGFLTSSHSFSWELPGRKRHKWGHQDATYANLPSSCSLLLGYTSAWQV